MLHLFQLERTDMYSWFYLHTHLRLFCERVIVLQGSDTQLHTPKTHRVLLGKPTNKTHPQFQFQF